MTLSLPLGWNGTHANLSNFDTGLHHNGSQINLTYLKFVTAYGLVGLACVIAQNAEAGFTTTIQLPESSGVDHYLSRMGFQRILDKYECLIFRNLTSVNSANLSDRLLELQVFEGSSGVRKLSELVWHRLDGRISPQSLTAIDVGLGEIADNVRYHSGLKWGFIAAQTYAAGTTQESIEFAIGDIGIVIRKGLERRKPSTDLEAIRLALQEGVSGLEDAGRGVGISTTVDEVTGLQGFVHLKSGEASVDVYSERTNDKQTIHLNGTIIGVDVPCYHNG